MGFLFKLLWLNVLLVAKTVRFVFATVTTLLVVAGYATLQMPGESYSMPLPPLTPDQKSLSIDIRYDIEVLAGRIGERHPGKPQGLSAAAAYIAAELEAAGYSVQSEPYRIGKSSTRNLVAELPGGRYENEIVVVGAGYTAPPGSPGANGNASGVAALLALARQMADQRLSRTVRFVFFGASSQSNWLRVSGAAVHLDKAGRDNQQVTAMLNLESLGRYSSENGSQSYPPPLNFLYPDSANFIAFSANPGSVDLLHIMVEKFRQKVNFPSQGFTFPEGEPGFFIGSHQTFWEAGIPAVLISDTGAYRSDDHHKAGDTVYKLDFQSMARVVGGVEKIVQRLGRMRR